jgi:hypothetical protein
MALEIECPSYEFPQFTWSQEVRFLFESTYMWATVLKNKTFQINQRTDLMEKHLQNELRISTSNNRVVIEIDWNWKYCKIHMNFSI